MAVRMTKSDARKAGILPGRVRKPPEVAVAAPLWWAVEFNLPCRVVSEANRRDHWSEICDRRNAQCENLRLAAILFGISGWNQMIPCIVTWTHVGRKMDSDNLARSFKGLRDGLAELLCIDDGDPRVEWRYSQRPGPPGVEVRIESGRDTPQPSRSASTGARGTRGRKKACPHCTTNTPTDERPWWRENCPHCSGTGILP